MSVNTSFARLLNVLHTCAKCAYAKERVGIEGVVLSDKSWIPDVLFQTLGSAKVHMYQQIKKDS